MNAIPTDEAMRHLYAEEEDRALIELLLSAAEDSASQYLNRRFYADEDLLAAAVLDGSAGRDPILIAPSIRAACLLILGSLYSNREDVAAGTTLSELPMGSRALLTPYRIGWGV
ncbi:MAG TPA: head-tail connector protein [Pseudomonas sp.]|uniref:head-tail connector protein n=1 Tax=Pseudomonas sp. TaxID=306 RepID=UPI002EDA3DD8